MSKFYKIRDRTQLAAVGWVKGYRLSSMQVISASDLELVQAFKGGWKARSARTQKKSY